MKPEDLEKLVTQLRTEGVTAEQAKSDARVQALKPFDRFALLFALRVRESFASRLGGLTGLAQELRHKPLSTWDGDQRYSSLPFYKRMYVLALGNPIALGLFACAVLVFQLASPSTSSFSLSGSKVIDLENNEENCAKIAGASRLWKEEVGRALGLQPGNIEILGGRKELLSYSSCFVTVRTPLGVKDCLSGAIASEDGGKTAYAVYYGAQYGFKENRTCKDR